MRIRSVSLGGLEKRRFKAHMCKMKTPAEQLDQAERDIANHNEAERIEWARFERENTMWTGAQRADFEKARQACAAHLAELVSNRDTLKREQNDSH